MILEFKDEYRWLSNFVDVAVEIEGKKFKSVEHAYQSVKSIDEEWKIFCASDITAGKVKRKSRKIEVREDWEDMKVEIMDKLLKQKFSNSLYKALLLGTGKKYIIEGNKWGDIFWGVDLKSGEGKNILGNLIMKIRDSLMNDIA